METASLPPLPPRRKRLYWAFKDEAITPQGKDEVWAAMSEAASEELLEGEFGDRLDEIFDERENQLAMPPMEPAHQMQFIRRGLQHTFLKMFPETYPNHFRTVEKNREAIRALLSDPIHFSDFEEKMLTEEVRSNVLNRAAAVGLTIATYGERLDDKPSILEVGCSLNLILKKLALRGYHHFQQLEVMMRKSDGRLVLDEEMTSAVNKILASRLVIGASIGVDLFAIDFGNREWVRSCSFYPEELLKPARLMEFDDIASSEARGVGFYQSDFSSPKEMANLPRVFARAKWRAEKGRSGETEDAIIEMAEYMTQQHKEEDLFDMVLFCTSMYLMNQTQRVKSLQMANKLVKSQGLVVIKDFAELNSRSRTGLRFHNDFQYAPYPWRSYVVPGNAATTKPRHIFSWENGRAQRLIIENGKVAVGGVMKSPRQLILESSARL